MFYIDPCLFQNFSIFGQKRTDVPSAKETTEFISLEFRLNTSVYVSLRGVRRTTSPCQVSNPSGKYNFSTSTQIFALCLSILVDPQFTDVAHIRTYIQLTEVSMR